MNSEFDPYYKWLGIAPREQPPNPFRLLGINQLESDGDVIDAAADQRMAFLQTKSLGEYSEHAQRIMNEVATARLSLLDRSKKSSSAEMPLDAPPSPEVAVARPTQQPENEVPTPHVVPEPTVIVRQSAGSVDANSPLELKLGNADNFDHSSTTTSLTQQTQRRVHQAIPMGPPPTTEKPLLDRDTSTGIPRHMRVMFGQIRSHSSPHQFEFPFEFESDRPIRPDQVPPRPAPVYSSYEWRYQNAFGCMAIAIGALTALALAIPPIALLTVPASAILAGLWVVRRYKSPVRQEERNRKELIVKIQGNIEVERAILLKSRDNWVSKYSKKKQSLTDLTDSYSKLVEERDGKANRLRLKNAHAQRQEFLSETSIFKCDLLDRSLLTLLEQAGIKSVADIQGARVRAVPSFGKKRSQILMEWRNSVAQNFVPAPCPDDVLRPVFREYSERLSLLDGAISQSLLELDQFGDEAKAVLKRQDQKVLACRRQFEQAMKDYEVIGSIPWWQ